jgi:uncharacterized protein YjiS (DUF1127 family)
MNTDQAEIEISRTRSFERFREDERRSIMAALTRALVADNGLATLFAGVAATFKAWNQRLEARRELAELSFREIQDIGIDQAELDHEIAKPFWRA